MNIISKLITKWQRWRYQRAVTRIRYALSLLVDPTWVSEQNNKQLIEGIMHDERQRAELADDKPRSLFQLAKDFEITWRLFAAHADQEIVKAKIQDYYEFVNRVEISA